MSADFIDHPLVLVPGLWFGRPAMWPLALALRRRGARVRLFSYPSRRLDLAREVARLAAFCGGAGLVNLVGYSLGGLLVAQFCREFPARYRYAVTLGTPFQGSEAARVASGFAVGRVLLGSAAPVLTTGYPSPAPPRFGIIIGTRPGGLLRRRAYQGDGVVAVEEARLPGATDALALPLSHIGLVHASRSVEGIEAFLNQGRFRGSRRGFYGRT
ncbi:MAG: hypothetical protein M0Z76_09530 [Gammaproteobacteria bacterium]|nr:hypothetical protein [Gammaproteobacteria bacterium]